MENNVLYEMQKTQNEAIMNLESRVSTLEANIYEVIEQLSDIVEITAKLCNTSLKQNECTMDMNKRFEEIDDKLNRSVHRKEEYIEK